MAVAFGSPSIETPSGPGSFRDEAGRRSQAITGLEGAEGPLGRLGNEQPAHKALRAADCQLEDGIRRQHEGTCRPGAGNEAVGRTVIR